LVLLIKEAKNIPKQLLKHNLLFYKDKLLSFAFLKGYIIG